MTFRTDRIGVLQSIIDAKSAAVKYIEIGVRTGSCFLAVRASSKIAVDPMMVIRRPAVVRAILRDPRNLFNRYYLMESDSFFQRHSDLFARNRIDVAFIDGLHTYQQSYRDLVNVLDFLNPDGVVVLHDCNPTDWAAACPAQSPEEVIEQYPSLWKGTWCGDVWKTIVRIRSTRDDLRVCVLDCDTGLGIVTRGYAESMLEYTLDDIDAMDYEDLANDRAALLNLREVTYLNSVLAERDLMEVG